MKYSGVINNKQQFNQHFHMIHAKIHAKIHANNVQTVITVKSNFWSQ